MNVLYSKENRRSKMKPRQRYNTTRRLRKNLKQGDWWFKKKKKRDLTDKCKRMNHSKVRSPNRKGQKILTSGDCAANVIATTCLVAALEWGMLSALHVPNHYF
jgi:hypothetical protein